MSAIKFRDEDGKIIKIPYLKGDPGYTPQKGVDYYTEAERQALIAELGARDVDQALNEGSLNAIANWVVTAELARLEYALNNTGYDFNERINANVERLDAAEQNMIGLSNADYGLHEHIVSVDERLAGVEETTASHDTGIETAHTRLDEVTTRINEDLEPRVGCLEEGVIYSNNRADYAHERIDAIEQQIGNIEAALDGILVIQESLIGGDAE